MKALSNALRPDGMLISQLGENFNYDSSGLHYSVNRIEYEFMQNLIEYGFDRMEDYTEAHGGFSAEWKYKILFKCGECHHSRWHRNQALVELDMKKRSMKCINDCNLFKFFDGATMMGYQYVSRINEAVFCRDIPQNLPDRPELWCTNRHGFDPEVKHVSLYTIQNDAPIETSNGFDSLIHAAEIMPSFLSNFTYVGLDASAQNILIVPATTGIIRQMSSASNRIDIPNITQKQWSLFESLFDRFSVQCAYWGASCYFVSLRLLLMSMNSPTSKELQINNSFPMLIREGLLPNITSSLDTVIYNPYISRNHLNFQWIYDLMKA
jgi:hypothetical protein